MDPIIKEIVNEYRLAWFEKQKDYFANHDVLINKAIIVMEKIVMLGHPSYSDCANSYDMTTIDPENILLPRMCDNIYRLQNSYTYAAFKLAGFEYLHLSPQDVSLIRISPFRTAESYSGCEPENLKKLNNNFIKARELRVKLEESLIANELIDVVDKLKKIAKGLGTSYCSRNYDDNLKIKPLSYYTIKKLGEMTGCCVGYINTPVIDDNGRKQYPITDIRIATQFFETIYDSTFWKE